MKGIFSTGNTSTLAFILGIVAIIAICVAAPGMVQAMLGVVTPTSSGEVSPGSSTMAFEVKSPVVNPGGLADTGIYGTVGIGTASPLSPLHISSTTSTQPETIDLSGVGPMTAQWNNYYNGSSAGSGFLARFARGTKGAESNVLAGDRLGFIVFGGWAGGAFRHTAGITGAVDTGTVSATSLPTYLAFTTTPNGSVTRTERMRIDSAGRVGINSAPVSGYQLYVYSDNVTSQTSAIYGATYNGETAGVAGAHANSKNVGALGSNAWGAYGTNNGSGNSGSLGNEESGVYGHGIGISAGVHGDSDTGVGVTGHSSSTSIYGSLGTPSYGVYGEYSVTGSNTGYIGGASYGVYGSGSGSNIGVFGQSASGNGVNGSSSTGTGVRGINSSPSGSSGTGVSGSGYAYGVQGTSTSPTGTGVFGQGSGFGVYGSSSAPGFAGYFLGNVGISGSITKGSGTFKIDHPQDPENKFLSHSFVESPDMKNVYDGTILLDGNGEALVELPAYFEALNRDFRYQLTCIGEPAVLYIAEEISGNHFRIAGGKAGMKVSWQVTGIRQDAFANAHPIVVEQEKPAGEQGYYLHPVEWGQPVEKGIDRATNK